MIILLVKKLTTIVNKAPTANQKIRNPTVMISMIRQTPAIINQICHMKNSSFDYKLLLL